MTRNIKEDAPAMSVSGGSVPLTDPTTNYAKQKDKYKKVLKRKLTESEEKDDSFTHYVGIKYPSGNRMHIKVKANDEKHARELAGGRVGRGAEVTDVVHRDTVHNLGIKK